MDELLSPLPSLALQGHVGAEAGFEGMALQGPAAEAVDGRDVGAIQPLQGQQQPSLDALHLLGFQGRAPLLQRFIGLGVFRIEQDQGVLQAAGDAVPQFRGSSIREGDHQQLLDLQGPRPLAEEPQHQMGQGEGLAGAGARLQQANPRREAEGVGIKGGQAHALTSLRRSNNGPCRRNARLWSSGVSRSPRGRSEPKQTLCTGSSRSARC